MLCAPHLLPTIKRRARFDHLLLWPISASVTGAVPAAAQSSRLLYVYERPRKLLLQLKHLQINANEVNSYS